MTSVQNRLLPLSGNKSLAVIFAVALLAACSPKVQPVKKGTDVVVQAPSAKKPTEPKKETAITLVPTISLILPFDLDQVNLTPGAPKSSLKKADLAAEYYQGFKLALDSLTAGGQSFRLQVFDSKDEHAQAYNLALNTRVRTSNLIVGPVYPEGLKSFSQASGSLRKLTVSPLSPASPAVYKNPYLITMMPPLQYHCRKVAQYVVNSIKAKKVFVLLSGFSADSKYAVPFKRSIDTLSRGKVKVIQYTVVRGDINALIPQLSATEQNVFVVPSTDQKFLTVTLRSLDLIRKKYPVTLIGHPNWEKVKFLRAELLQRLNTMITSSDKIDYHSWHVTTFLRAYRKVYHAEPGEYAIKGFDEGLYFGQFAAQKIGTPAAMQNYKGLHNSFYFENVSGQGWINTHVNLYKYANFDLKLVE